MGMFDDLMNDSIKGLGAGGFIPKEAAGMIGGAAPVAQAVGAAAPAAAPGLAAAAGGPIGLAAMGVGSLIGGAIEAAKKRKEAQVKELQAQAEGARNLGDAQVGGLGSLMAAYKGIL